MLSDEQIEILIDEYLIELYQELEKQVITDIARRVRKTSRLTETAEIMVKSMKEQGFSSSKILVEVYKHLNASPEYRKEIAENTYAYKQKIKKEIAETVKKARELGDEIVAKAGEMSFNSDFKMWYQAGKDLKESRTLKQIVESFQKQTNGALKNITKTTAFKNTELGTVDTLNAYQRALDVSLLKLASGNFSYDAACNDVIKQFANSGLRTVSYESGRTYQIDTAVRNTVRTGLSQLAGKITEKNCETTGQDLVIISQHWGCRDTHINFQNEIFSMNGKSKKYPHIEAPLGEGCAYGRPEGLCGPNCRHHFYPFFEGISEKPELIPEPAPKEYKGKTYDYYEATQKQRSMEREIRALKREKYCAETGKRVEHLNNLIKVKRAEYMSFSEHMGIRPKENRLLGVGERSQYAQLKEKIPQLKIAKTKKQLDKSIDEAIEILKNNPEVKRDELTLLFPTKTKVGINPITGKDVYVLDKDMSYFIWKHISDGSLTSKDLKNIGNIFNYDIVAKDLDTRGNGYMFIKKSEDRDGYLDGITKKLFNGEEIFHYQYRNQKYANKLISKKTKDGLIIEDKRVVDNLN